MAYPVTLAVIIPSVPAARAAVDICPMQMTDARTKEYSKTCVLGKSINYQVDNGVSACGVRKDWERILHEGAQFLAEHLR